jgi:uncharacterized protein (TIGR03435 family)
MKTILLLLVISGLCFGQAVSSCSAISPDAAKRQFDVASVKPAEPPTPDAMVGPLRGQASPFATTGGPGTDDPARYAVAHTSLSSLMLRAYGLAWDQLKGPPWLTDSVNSGYAINVTMPASTTQEQFCGMLRNLMAERFHLTFHYEKQARPGYELTVLPGGPKFKEFVPGSAADEGPKNSGLDAQGFPILPPSQPTANTWNARTAPWKVSFRNNMAAFALRLAADINRLNGTPAGPGVPLPWVVDKTGLVGIYDIRMEIAGMAYPGQAGDGTLAPATPDPVNTGPGVFAAVQKLGLKLTKVADVQVDLMIVDHVDRTPTEN